LVIIPVFYLISFSLSIYVFLALLATPYDYSNYAYIGLSAATYFSYVSIYAA